MASLRGKLKQLSTQKSEISKLRRKGENEYKKVKSLSKKYSSSLKSTQKRIETLEEELKLAKKIKADVVIKELEKAIEQVEIKQRKAMTFFGKINNRDLKDNLSYKFQKSDRDNYKKILQQWLRDQILSDSRYYIKLISKQINLNINEIKLSNSFNYWGSCNTKGIIHLNWRLIFAPTSVLKYIIVHEVCHLKEFNHTVKFWELVKKMCPNYKDQIKWLKKNDSYLHRIRFD